MRVLAFDTSSSATAVAVMVDGRCVVENDSAGEGRHGEVLLPRIGALLKQADLTLSELDLIAVGVGPGSFTGLRVGLATAKGLALAASLPLRGVSSLATLARGGRDDAGLVFPLLDAFKGEVFAAAYRIDENGSLSCERAELHAAPEAAAEQLSPWRDEPAIVCGDGARRYQEALQHALGPNARWASAERDLPRGRHVAVLGAELMQREGPSDLATLEPTYLRGSDAQLPRRPLSL